MKKILFDINDKYNTITIKYYFLQDRRNDNLTLRNIISSILLDGTINYKTPEDIEAKLDSFYGARIYSKVSVKGNKQAILFALEFVDPKLLNDKEYTIESVYSFFKEVLYKPYLKNNLFEQKNFKKQIKALENDLLSEIDNRDYYANNKIRRIIYRNTPGEYDIYGYLSDLKKITNEDLYKEYLNVINKNDLLIEVIGNINDNEKNLFENYNDDLRLEYYDIPQNDEFISIKEHIPSDASYLRLAYKTNITRFDEDYFSFIVFKELLAGDAYSFLFQNTRERLGLCYSIYSMYYCSKGVLMISSSFENKNYYNIIKSINEEIDKIRKGLFDDSLLSAVKNSIIDSYNKSLDSNRNNLDDNEIKQLYGINKSLFDFIPQLLKVCREDVIKVSNSIKLIGEYYLNGD